MDASASSSNAIPVVDKIRNVWSQKFDQPSAINDVQSGNAVEIDSDASNNNHGYVETKGTQKWEELDDGLMIWEEKHTIIDICDDDSNSDDSIQETKPNDQHEKSVFQPDAIKRELFEDLGENDDVIELIDDEFDDSFNESIHILTDTSVINDLFGEDTLLADFNNINHVIMNDPENRGKPNREIISCPICQDKMRREELNSHLEGCTGITVKIEIKSKLKAGISAPRQLPFYKNHAIGASTNRRIQRVNSIDQRALEQAGYSQDQIDRALKYNSEEKDYNARIMKEMAAEDRSRRSQQNSVSAAITNPAVVPATPTATATVNFTSGDGAEALPAENVPCPVCSQMVDANEINQHLDYCLANTFAD